MNLIAYPRLIYTQSTEPSDKTAGRIWVDTDDGKVYAANGTIYSPVSQDPYLQLYTGTGLNLVEGTTETANIELTEVTSSEIGDKDYCIMTISDRIQLETIGSGERSFQNLKIEIKEVGGAYSDIFPSARFGGDENGNACYIAHLTLPITLTEGMKTNGFQIKVSKTMTNSGTVAFNSYLNCIKLALVK